MASSRLLDDASSQYLERTDICGITDYPFTMSCWTKVDDSASDHTLIAFGNDTVGSLQGLYFNDSPAVVRAISQYGATAAVASATSGYPTGSWMHICGVFSNDTSRAIYMAGGDKGTNSTNIDFDSTYLDETQIGCFHSSGGRWAYHSGNIGLIILRNIALNDAEVAAEAAATSVAEALAIQSEAIIAYWFDGTESDADHDTGTYDMTPVNSPTWDSGDWPFAGGVSVGVSPGLVNMAAVVPTLTLTVQKNIAVSPATVTIAGVVFDATVSAAGGVTNVGVSPDTITLAGVLVDPVTRVQRNINVTLSLTNAIGIVDDVTVGTQHQISIEPSVLDFIGLLPPVTIKAQRYQNVLPTIVNGVLVLPGVTIKTNVSTGRRYWRRYGRKFSASSRRVR